MRTAVICIVAMIGLASCGDDDTPGSESRFPLPTHESEEGGPTELALLEGVLEARVQGSATCVFVASESGSLISVVWPRGFEARVDDTSEVVVMSGEDVRAREGDRVVLGGGERDDAPPSCASSQRQGYFLATSVSSDGG